MASQVGVPPHGQHMLELRPFFRPRDKISMEGGMRMPPNQEEVRQAAGVDLASMEGGMRMPPNDAHEHPMVAWWTLQWRAACACRRIPGPNLVTVGANKLQWRAACACRRIRCSTVQRIGDTHHASMEGGMRMPPNLGFGATIQIIDGASMEGGMRMPPNRPRPRG